MKAHNNARMTVDGRALLAKRDACRQELSARPLLASPASGDGCRDRRAQAGGRTGPHIAVRLGPPRSTVGAIPWLCRRYFPPRLSLDPARREERGAFAFLLRARAFFAAHGVRVERVVTDNGAAHRRDDFRNLCAASRLRHIRTRPYTPRTERFILTSLREWAYARPYRFSAENEPKP